MSGEDEEMRGLEDGLVRAIVQAFASKGVAPRQGILGLFREDGRFQLRDPVPGFQHGVDAIGALALGGEADEELPLYEDLARVVGDTALMYGIIRGWDGLAAQVPNFIEGEESRRYFLLGMRVGVRARREVLGV